MQGSVEERLHLLPHRRPFARNPTIWERAVPAFWVSMILLVFCLGVAISKSSIGEPAPSDLNAKAATSGAFDANRAACLAGMSSLAYITPDVLKDKIDLLPAGTQAEVFGNITTETQVFLMKSGSSIVISFRGTIDNVNWKEDTDTTLVSCGEASTAACHVYNTRYSTPIGDTTELLQDNLVYVPASPGKEITGVNPKCITTENTIQPDCDAPPIHFTSSEGSTKMYSSIRETLYHALHRLRDGRPAADFDLIVTGHSLGGALAIETALDQRLLSLSHPYRSLSIYTFGAPRTAGRGFQRAFNQLIPKDAWMVQNYYDPVPHLPSQAPDGYVHVGRVEVMGPDPGQAKEVPAENDPSHLAFSDIFNPGEHHVMITYLRSTLSLSSSPSNGGSSGGNNGGNADDVHKLETAALALCADSLLN